MAIASGILGFFLAKKKQLDLLFLVKAPPLIYLAALALAFNFYGYMNCIELTTASNAQIMIQTGPLMLAIFGVFFFKERPNKTQITGFIMATFGFLFFYQDQLLISWSKQDQYLQGNLWIIGAAITWAFYTVIQKHYSYQFNPQKILFLVFLVSSVVLLPIANFKNLQSLTFLQWLLVILLGFNSWLAYGSLGEALKRAPASHVSLIITLNPLLTIFLIQMLNQWNLLFIPYELLNFMSYAGAGLVVTGVSLTILAQKNLAQKIKSSSQN